MPADASPSTTSPGLDARAVDQPLALHDADARAREVELLVAVDAGQLGGLATQDRAARLAADLCGALDELRHLLGVDPVGRDVVEQHERVGPRREHVVDAVRGEIHAAPAQLSGTAREDELRADAVGGRDEQPPLVDRVETGEGAEGAHDAGRARRVDRRPEPVDDRLGGSERDPCGGVGLLLRRHAASVAAAAGVAM